MFGRSGIERKDAEQLRAMRRAGLVVGQILQALQERVAPGVTTAELDAHARELLAQYGATSNFLGYGAEWGIQPFPGVCCTSVNEQVVHGIPSDRPLAAGDIVSVDFGAIVDGWHGDAARTFRVGQVDDEVAELSRATREAMWAGIGVLAPGRRVGDVSAAIQASIESEPVRYGIVRDYTGHGIGTEMHMDPDIPNFGRAGRGPRLAQGMCVCIEPMLVLGGEEVAELDDDWTVVTADGRWASHWENTVALTDQGLWVLTEIDGGEAELTARGLPFAPLGD